jgi:hypothetical protein
MSLERFKSTLSENIWLKLGEKMAIEQCEKKESKISNICVKLVK